MSETPLQTEPLARAIAFYLPQFHPIAENDEWWGRGFTEWRNVAKARPKFSGHLQPRLPADLGFYDLRLDEARVAQVEMAKAFGLHGFCYYHYWFNGRRLLERPLEIMLRSREAAFPFTLCWANENWTRRWDGQDQEVLMKQEYSEADDLDHIRFLCPILADPRYIRVEGKPLLLIYRTERLPNAQRTVEIWREEALRLGVGELYLARVDCETEFDPRTIGMDASIEFAPTWRSMPPRYFGDGLVGAVRRRLDYRTAHGRNSVYRYRDLAHHLMNIDAQSDYARFRCACPSWDNSPRRPNTGSTIFLNPEPKCFEEWVRFLVKTRQRVGVERAPIFINAWNEWAECAQMEPCDRFGTGFLEALRAGLGGVRP